MVATRSFVNEHALTRCRFKHKNEVAVCVNIIGEILGIRVGILFDKREKCVLYVGGFFWYYMLFLLASPKGIPLEHYGINGILQAHRLPTDVNMRHEEYLSAPSPIVTPVFLTLSSSVPVNINHSPQLSQIEY